MEDAFVGHWVNARLMRERQCFPWPILQPSSSRGCPLKSLLVYLRQSRQVSPFPIFAQREETFFFLSFLVFSILVSSFRSQPSLMPTLRYIIYEKKNPESYLWFFSSILEVFFARETSFYVFSPFTTVCKIISRVFGCIWR